MVGARDRSSSLGKGCGGIEDSIMPTTLVLTPTAQEAKYWAKKHRTFVASSVSGMLASGCTVSFPSRKCTSLRNTDPAYSFLWIL